MTSLTKEAIFAQLDSTEEFPINLSEVWEWLGFNQKSDAVDSLKAQNFLEGIEYGVLRNQSVGSQGGRPLTEYCLTVDCFKLWAMSVRTERGKEVRRYYLQMEKEWKLLKSQQPQINADHVIAYNFQENQLNPLKRNHPIAAQYLYEWEGLPFIKLESVEVETPKPAEFSLPPEIVMKTVNDAFLNLNRQGLAMNKLFKFVDRMPTMANMDAKIFENFSEAISEAAGKISELQQEKIKNIKTIEKLKKDLKEESTRRHEMARIAVDLKYQLSLANEKLENLNGKGMNKTLSPDTKSKAAKDAKTIKDLESELRNARLTIKELRAEVSELLAQTSHPLGESVHRSTLFKQLPPAQD